VASWRLISWNVNGIRAVEKKGFLDWFKAEAPDVLCLQETRAAEEQVPKTLRALDDYCAYFESGERKGYSGVALFTKREPQKLWRGFGLPPFDNEGRILAADYGHFVLFNIYFPNGGSGQPRLDYKMRFYEAFLDHVDALRAAGRHIVICGDVNTAHKEIDLARPRANEAVSGFLPIERAWMDTLVSHGYVDTFRMFNQQPHQYTWWDQKSGARERNVGWRIDYFFVDEGLLPNVTHAFIQPHVLGSDHCPVGLHLTLPD